MPWVRFDDEYPENRKIKRLSDSAYRLHSEAIFWCARHLTDGFVPADELDDVTNVRRPAKLLPDLMQRRLWEPVEGGWLIHDYLEYQPSAEKVREEREARKKRQERWLAKKRNGKDASASASEDASHDASKDDAPYPPRPVPSLGVKSLGHLTQSDARENDDDDDRRITQATIDAIHATTGRSVNEPWARRVVDQILAGRTPGNRTAYVVAAIRDAPDRYVPTSTPPNVRDLDLWRHAE
jgi:hypothetical protein